MPENLIEKTRNTPIDQWSMINVAAMLSEIYTKVHLIEDAHKRIEKNIDKKANKWVERAVSLFMLGTTSWALYQVASLIDVANAFFK